MFLCLCVLTKTILKKHITTVACRLCVLIASAAIIRIQVRTPNWFPECLQLCHSLCGERIVYVNVWAVMVSLSFRYFGYIFWFCCATTHPRRFTCVCVCIFVCGHHLKAFSFEGGARLKHFCLIILHGNSIFCNFMLVHFSDSVVVCPVVFEFVRALVKDVYGYDYVCQCVCAVVVESGLKI